MADAKSHEARRVLYEIVRHPSLWGISIFGTLFTAIQISGITAVPIAEGVLFFGWLFAVCTEIYLWVSSLTGKIEAYKNCFVLLFCCLTGMGFLYFGAWMYVMRTEQDLGCWPRAGNFRPLRRALRRCRRPHLSRHAGNALHSAGERLREA
jgi:hypothetical protein